MEKRDSQTKQLAKWLKSGKTIQPLEALRELGIYRLAARCQDLRDEGLNIKTTMIYAGPVKYAQYSLNRKRK